LLRTRTAPRDVQAVNFAFDVTADLVTAMVADRPVIRPDKGDRVA
jgi:methylthioribose-1-phosphate isomerase